MRSSSPHVDLAREPSPVAIPPSHFSRSGRQRRPPKALRDFIPHALNGLPAHIPRPPPHTPVQLPLHEHVPSPSSPSLSPSQPEYEDKDELEYDTEPNIFGVFKRYTEKPQRDPEDCISLDDLCDSSKLAVAPADPVLNTNPLGGFGKKLSNELKENIYFPFLNASVFRLMNWFYSGSPIKSAAELERLVKEVILAEDFAIKHFIRFRTLKEFSRLDALNKTDASFATEDGWQQGSVDIPLPFEKKKYKSEADTPKFQVTEIWFRRLLEVIKAAYQDPIAAKYHFLPHRMYWRRTTRNPPSRASSETSSATGTQPTDEVGTEDIQIYSEIYNSEAMIEEDAKMRAEPRQPEDPPELEYAIAPMIAYSDSVRLASFGLHSLWPIYLFFASLSKYFRGKPSSFAAHHLAYMPTVCSISRLTILMLRLFYPSFPTHYKITTRSSTVYRLLLPHFDSSNPLSCMAFGVSF